MAGMPQRLRIYPFTPWCELDMTRLVEIRCVAWYIQTCYFTFCPKWLSVIPTFKHWWLTTARCQTDHQEQFGVQFLAQGHFEMHALIVTVSVVFFLATGLFQWIHVWCGNLDPNQNQTYILKSVSNRHWTDANARTPSTSSFKQKQRPQCLRRGWGAHFKLSRTLQTHTHAYTHKVFGKWYQRSPREVSWSGVFWGGSVCQGGGTDSVVLYKYGTVMNAERERESTDTWGR